MPRWPGPTSTAPASAIGWRCWSAPPWIPCRASTGGPFDLVFIDADKENNPGYLEWAVKLTRPGSVIVVDNVIREGAILSPDQDAVLRGTARCSR